MGDTSKKEIIHGFDLIKFIFAFFVVAIHTEIFGAYIYLLVRIAVPLYFVISAYMLFKGMSGKDKKEQLNILKKYVIRNLLLYLFWFIVLSY